MVPGADGFAVGHVFVCYCLTVHLVPILCPTPEFICGGGYMHMRRRIHTCHLVCLCVIDVLVLRVIIVTIIINNVVTI